MIDIYLTAKLFKNTEVNLGHNLEYDPIDLPRMDQPRRRPSIPPISANSSAGPVMKYS
jgi:hypothetical protein